MPAALRFPRILVSRPLAALACAGMIGCRGTPQPPIAEPATIPARAAVILPGGGERRLLRGEAPLLIKIDPVNTGSRRMVLGSSDLPPGDAIAAHRHLREDEIIIITRGTARVQLGTQLHTAGPGATVFIPQGTCIAVTNIGADTLSNTFIFSSPGFEQVLRAVSTVPGETPRRLTAEERAIAFSHGHAQASPSDC